MPSQDLASHLKRVWQLIEMLPSKKGALTAEELWHHGQDLHQWMTTDRTLHRDLDALKTLRIATATKPLADTTGRGGRARRWYRAASKDTRKVRMTTEEAVAMVLAERLAGRLLPATMASALKSQFGQAHRQLDLYKKMNPQLRWADKVEVIHGGIARKPRDVRAGVLRNLQEALLTDHQVSARYRSMQRKTLSVVHTLEPRALVQQGDVLYVIATRPDKPDYKPAWFAVHRFISAKVLEDKVTPRVFSIKEFIAKGGADHGSDGQTIVFKASISKFIRKRLREAPLSGDQRIGRDGSDITVTATVRPSFPFETWLMGNADEVVVLEPQALRARIAKRLAAAIAGYGNSAPPSPAAGPTQAPARWSRPILRTRHPAENRVRGSARRPDVQ